MCYPEEMFGCYSHSRAEARGERESGAADKLRPLLFFISLSLRLLRGRTRTHENRTG